MIILKYIKLFTRYNIVFKCINYIEDMSFDVSRNLNIWASCSEAKASLGELAMVPEVGRLKGGIFQKNVDHGLFALACITPRFLFFSH